MQEAVNPIRITNHALLKKKNSNTLFQLSMPASIELMYFILHRNDVINGCQTASCQCVPGYYPALWPICNRHSSPSIVFEIAGFACWCQYIYRMFFLKKQT